MWSRVEFIWLPISPGIKYLYLAQVTAGFLLGAAALVSTDPRGGIESAPSPPGAVTSLRALQEMSASAVWFTCAGWRPSRVFEMAFAHIVYLVSLDVQKSSHLVAFSGCYALVSKSAAVIRKRTRHEKFPNFFFFFFQRSARNLRAPIRARQPPACLLPFRVVCLVSQRARA